ncbi:MAG TPA: lamin tail domain-containing protein [Eubacteriales bacterium]|nr:lamin tail domain-containing protein [Eubacteriales bacterium]
MAILSGLQLPKGKRGITRKKFASIAITIACLLGLALVLCFKFFGRSSESASGQLVISEVMASNRYSLVSESLGTPDWIELHNESDEDIDLSGYSLTNNVKNLRKFTFPDVVIGAGEYLIVYACDIPEDGGGDLLATGFNISKSGENLFLSDEYAGLIQQLEVPELSTDISYVRSTSGEYGFTYDATPGTANDDASISATLAQLLDAASGSLVLNEVVPYPAEGSAWAELYNDSDEAVQLSNYFISDHSDDPLRFRLPEYVLKPHGFAVVCFSSGDTQTVDGWLTADFWIGKDDVTLQLTNADGTLESILTWSADQPAGVAVVQGDEYRIAVPTPLEENPDETWTFQEPAAMTESDPVVISEVMPVNKGLFPDQDGDTSEWVEIYNRSSAPVSLSGYYLSDDPENPAQYALPEQTLGTGEYLVVWLSGKDTSGGELHANFGLSVGETLTLTDLSTMRQDTCTIDGDCPQDASFSASADGGVLYYGTPTPGYENAKPYSLAEQTGWFDSGGVFISEVSASGDTGDDDWIELYNGSAGDVSLDGWSLTDDFAEPDKLQLSGVTVSAGSYYVIDLASAGESAAFGISFEGESLFLLEPDGRPHNIFRTGVLSAGVTSGRIVSDETTERVFFSEPTRGEANSSVSFSGYACLPAFSETELYWQDAFSLVIDAASDNAVVRYTTDGSYPTEESDVFSGAIDIDESCVVRAVSFQSGLLPSACISMTYLFSEPHTIPVVCVAAEPDELKPVLKTTQRENKPECASELSYYDESGAFCVSFRAGLRAKGRSMLRYSQKSFSVKLRGRYGQTSVTYPFFGESDIITYSAFSLRSGGQDRGRARLRDSYFSRLAEGLFINNIQTQIVALYLNGSFYGIFDLNEEQDESYLASHYGVDEDAVDVINRNDEVKEGSADEFLRVREFAAEEDLSDDAVYTQFCEWVDVDYFTDYLVFRSYIADTDLINQAYWRSQDYSVKWQPILFDLDYGLYGNEYAQSYKKDVLSQYFSEDGVPSADKSKTYFEIYIGLKKNAGWRKQFVERYVELMHTTLSPENMLALLDEMEGDYLTEMPRQVEAIGFPSSIESTQQGLEQLRDAIQQRPAYALEYLKENFPDEADYIDELVRAYE